MGESNNGTASFKIVKEKTKRFRLLVLRANRVQQKKIISVHLVLDESNVLPTGSDVIANFKFFIYDQIRDNYLTVEANGYTINDSCTFGAEVQVIKNTRTAECLSCIEIPLEHQLVHTWKINNFSKFDFELCDPCAFTAAGRTWRIEIKTNYTNNWLCMKLKLDDTNCRTLAGLIKWLRKENNQRLYAAYTLGVKNQHTKTKT
ncbi:hypothetical protein AgCh_004117 [Apium graveolens]